MASLGIFDGMTRIVVIRSSLHLMNFGASAFIAFAMISILEPYGLQLPRLSLLVFAAVIGGWSYLKSRQLDLNAIYLLVGLLGLAVLGSLGVLTGVGLSEARLFLFWPVMIVLALLNFTNSRQIAALQGVLALSGIILILILLLMRLTPEPAWLSTLESGLGTSRGIPWGGTQSKWVAAMHLGFLIPFTLAWIHVKTRRLAFALRSLPYVSFALVAVLASMTTGYRSLAVLALASPFLVLLVLKFFKWLGQGLHRPLMKPLTSLLLLLTIPITTLAAINVPPHTFRRGVAILGVESDPRPAQALRLLEKFLQAPTFGHGFGFAVPGDDGFEQTAFELTPLILLNWFGILGLFVLLLSILVLYAPVVAATANWERLTSLFPFLVGVLGFLMVSILNPLLLSLGFLWILFLPLAAASSSDKPCIVERPLRLRGTPNRAAVPYPSEQRRYLPGYASARIRAAGRNPINIGSQT